MHADLLLTGGVIYTQDPRRPKAEAIAIVGNRIEAVGSSSKLLAYKGPNTRIVDLADRAVTPGFYDAHQHQVYLGLSFQQVNARVTTIEELVSRVRARAQDRPSGTWIEGLGYDDNRLAEQRHPNRWDLDRASSEHPVFITRTCGHVMVLNSLALKVAGIDRNTPDPPGGAIDRDPESGRPTGVIRESAMERVRRTVPPPSTTELKAAILEAAEENLRLGITSLWEPSVEPNHVRAYRDLEADGQLPLRVTMAHKKVLRSGEIVPLPEMWKDSWLSLVAVKLFQDGGIGPRTAAMSEPYVDEPDNKGLLRWPQSELNEMVDEIHRAGLRASIHAIGDRAIASALTAVETALEKTPRRGHGHRVEHCGLPLPVLHPRLVKLSVTPVLQPPFLYFDGRVYMRNLGPKRSRWLYPARTLMGLGLTVAGSSDAPVVSDRNPLLGIRTAVLRRAMNGQPVAPEEALTVNQALRLYTLGAAAAAGEEGEKGSISPGKYADLVVLQCDPMAVAPEDLADIPVEMVVIDGEIRLK